MSWEPINLRHVPDEPPEPPDYLQLVYRGRRHWFSGPPESLKTLVAYIVLRHLRVATSGSTPPRRSSGQRPPPASTPGRRGRGRRRAPRCAEIGCDTC